MRDTETSFFDSIAPAPIDKNETTPHRNLRLADIDFSIFHLITDECF